VSSVTASPASRPAKQGEIRAVLRSRIRGLAPGAALTPERLLATEFGVSRQTVRSAVDSLVSEGLLYRRQGSGTYVAEPERKLVIALTLMSFTEDMQRRGMRPSSRLLSMARASAGPVAGRSLEVSPREEVWTITRLRLADEEPMAIETLQLPVSVAPDLRRAHLDQGSFYEYLGARGVEIGSATQTIEATVVTGDEAEVLGVPEHSPAFLFDRISRNSSGVVIEHVRSVYRSDRYRLLTELRPTRIDRR
jgi:GntR family transcriptional regulator